jgi:hypothetical protein
MAANKYQNQSKTRSLTRFASNIQNIINTRILGSVTRPKQWKMPLNLKGDAVAKVSLSNKKTRLAIDDINHLIEYVWAAPDEREKKEIWLKMIKDYQHAMRILQKRSEYTVDDIVTFQLKIDDLLVLTLKNLVLVRRESPTIFTCWEALTSNIT